MISRQEAAEFSDALERYRKRRGMSQEQLAERATEHLPEGEPPLRFNSISYFERCPRTPLRRRQHLKAIVQALGLSDAERVELSRVAGGL